MKLGWGVRQTNWKKPPKKSTFAPTKKYHLPSNLFFSWTWTWTCSWTKTSLSDTPQHQKQQDGGVGGRRRQRWQRQWWQQGGPGRQCTMEECQTNVTNVVIWRHIWNAQWRKVKQMQPMRLCLLGRDDFRLLVTKPYGHETRSTGYRNKHLKLHGSVWGGLPYPPRTPP